MKHTLFTLTTLLSTTILVGYAAPGFAQGEATEPVQIKVGGMTHAMVLGEYVGIDPAFANQTHFRKDPRAYMIQDQNRLDVTATQGDYRFYLQTTFGGEETTYGSSLPVNSVIDLLDCYAQTPFFGLGRLTLGQFKVPYGREGLNDEHYLLFNDKSIENLGFVLNRDYGAALEMNLGPLSLTGAVVSLGSRNVPPRYIPEVFGVPGIVARIGYGNESDDIQALKQSKLNMTDTEWGVYANGVYSKDSLVGHGSVFSSRTSDKNLMFNKNYNPYLSEPDPALNNKAAQAEYWQYGVNGGYATPMLGGVVAAQGELNYSSWANRFHQLRLAGAQAQLSYTLNPVAFGLRYGMIIPDTNMQYTQTTTTTTYTGTVPSSGTTVPVTAKTTTASKLWPIFKDASPIQEITPSVVWYLKGENLKLILDAPIALNTPVFNESNIGPYVFKNQPDQVSYVTNGISNQLDVQVRLGVQAQF